MNQNNLGFVILVNPFNSLEQTERLIRKLNEMFDFPPIACHFDFGKNPSELENRTSNVKVVRPHIHTKWADFSCIEAAIAAIRLLYSDGIGPDWFVYLSGADYPIKPAARILADLAASPYDAHIEHLLVENCIRPANPNPPRPEGYKGAIWPKACHKRFCSIRLTIPWITKRLTLSSRTYWLNQTFITRGKLPFNNTFQCYAGEAWWCARRKAAETILQFYDRDQAFAAHCRKILVPEECYFQTVLANDSSLRLSQNYLRYVDWSAGGSHPKMLQKEDFEKMRQTDAHFARKFDYRERDPIIKKLNRVMCND